MIEILNLIYLAQQLTVQPQSVVQAEGLEAVFECLCPEAVFHIWAINGIFPSDSEFPPNFTQHRPVGDIPAKLIIPAISAYNSTVVQCEALFREGGECGQSENTTLKVQGIFRLYYKSHTTVIMPGMHA